MWALLASVGAVGLLVWRGMKRSLAPVKDESSEREKLMELKAKGRWTLDEAEDGLVLARRYGDGAAAAKFSKIVVELRKRRAKI